MAVSGGRAVEGPWVSVEQKCQCQGKRSEHRKPTHGIIMNKSDEIREVPKAVCAKKYRGSAGTGLKRFSNWEEKLQKNFFNSI